MKDSWTTEVVKIKGTLSLIRPKAIGLSVRKFKPGDKIRLTVEKCSPK